MSFAATMSTSEPRSFSDGPFKKQLFTWSALATDASGTITCDRLSSVLHVQLEGGMSYTAAPTYATNVATLAFTPTAPVIYTCSCDSGSATVGALYTDTAGNTFSVGATVASAVAITLKGVKPPTAGTLTKLSGTGDATLTTVAITSAPTFYGTGIAYGR